MRLQKNQKLVLIGDSITDAGRTRPIGEGLFEATGKGYVTHIEALMGAVYPTLGVRVVNVGNSGDTIRDLSNRWQKDVFDLKPDWLSVMIGINDVWRQFDSPRQKEIHVYLEEYESTYRKLLEKTRSTLKGGLILATPFFIEPNKHDAMRAEMDKYGAVVKKLARDFDAVLVDTQAAFDEALKTYHPGALAWDRIHPNQIGHMIMALAFVKALGFAL